MLIKGEIKTQTPFVKKESLSYPLTEAQLKKLLNLHFVWFLCTQDDTIASSKKYMGNIFRISAKKLYNYLITVGYGDKNNDMIKCRGKDTWINIPINLFKKTGQISKEKMISCGIGGMGNTQYIQSKNGNWFRYGFKSDKNKMNAKGKVGEQLILDHFRNQSTINTVKLNQYFYDSYDILIDCKIERR